MAVKWRYLSSFTVPDPRQGKDDRGCVQPVFHHRRQFLHLFGKLRGEIGAIVWIILQIVELFAGRSGD